MLNEDPVLSDLDSSDRLIVLEVINKVVDMTHSPGLYTSYKLPPQIFCDARRALHFCQCPTLRNRTVNTALLLVAVTRRRAVVGCHAVLFLVARRHAPFETNTVLWAFHTIQPSSFNLFDLHHKLLRYLSLAMS